MEVQRCRRAYRVRTSVQVGGSSQADVTCPVLSSTQNQEPALEGTDGMKRQQCSEGQISSILKEAEAGAVATALCRKHGISSATCYAWKARPGGLGRSDRGRCRA